VVGYEDLALLRKGIRAQKQKLLRENLSFNDKKAEKFWPIYKHYTEDLKGIMTKNSRCCGITRERGENQALPGKKAAASFQLDRRISMLIDVQLASQIPLAHGKDEGDGGS
jgi:hypothetical protein